MEEQRKSNLKSKGLAKANDVKVIVAAYDLKEYAEGQKLYYEWSSCDILQFMLLNCRIEQGSIKEPIHKEEKRYCALHTTTEMKVKNGKNGPFFGCPRYPHCTYTEPVKTKPTGISEEDARSKLDLAFDFVDEVGSVEIAQRLLDIVKRVKEL